jgi:hypothetical protein
MRRWGDKEIERHGESEIRRRGETVIGKYGVRSAECACLPRTMLGSGPTGRQGVWNVKRRRGGDGEKKRWGDAGDAV